jgi:LCP family protein required for cell wall assembly
LTDTPRHADRVRKHRVLKIVAASVAGLLVVVLAGGFFVYQHLNGNITQMDVTKDLGTDRPAKVAPVRNEPTKPLNVLILGSDSREGAGNKVGGETPGLSDTTILLHLSANRKLAYGVSLPRDAMVERPACKRKDGNGTDAGGLTQFNSAYAVGGPACTIKTIEKLTDVYVDHFVVIDFNGFKKMVNALNGVQVCVPREVNDTTGHIHLPKGTYDVKGQRALDYVRVRHDIGTVENGDIGRMKRQQTFLASMANKVVSAGTLANPIRLYKFADAATKSLTTDPGLASLGKLRGLASSFSGIGLDKIQFLTVPFQEYAPDPNRLQWAPSADKLWQRMRTDQPLNKVLAGDVTTAADDNAGAGSSGPSSSPSAGASSPSASPSQTAAAQARAEEAVAKAEANGLCA